MRPIFCCRPDLVKGMPVLRETRDFAALNPLSRFQEKPPLFATRTTPRSSACDIRNHKVGPIRTVGVGAGTVCPPNPCRRPRRRCNLRGTDPLTRPREAGKENALRYPKTDASLLGGRFFMPGEKATAIVSTIARTTAIVSTIAKAR